MSISAGREHHDVSSPGDVAIQPAQVTTGDPDAGVPASAAVLQTTDLTLAFGQRTILRDVNLNVQRGAITP